MLIDAHVAANWPAVASRIPRTGMWGNRSDWSVGSGNDSSSIAPRITQHLWDTGSMIVCSSNSNI